MWRQSRSYGLLMTIVLLVVLDRFVPITVGQVTFSRDWSPGKRAFPTDGGNCLQNDKSIATLCHMLMNELKQLSTCEVRAMVGLLQSRSDDISDSASYSGGQ